MRSIQVTKRTPAEIHALFDEVFKDVRPAAPTGSAQERLLPYKNAVLNQRKRGCTWAQIAAGMRDPRIGVVTTPKTLRAAFGAADRRKMKPSAPDVPPDRSGPARA